MEFLMECKRILDGKTDAGFPLFLFTLTRPEKGVVFFGRLAYAWIASFT